MSEQHKRTLDSFPFFSEPERRKFTTKVEQLLQKKGVVVRRGRANILDLEFFFGNAWAEDENGDTYPYEKQVGSLSSKYIPKILSVPRDAAGQSFETAFTAEIECYRFDKDLHDLFPEILAAVPPTVLCRIVETPKELALYFYPKVTPDEHEKLLRPTVPLANGSVLVGQGEWVLLEAHDAHHTLVNFGRVSEACRYILLHDPDNNRVASTHLDDLKDVQVVAEMLGHMMRRGSRKEQVRLLASSNMNPSFQEELQRTLPNSNFTLDQDHVFNVVSGEFTEFTGSEEEPLVLKDRVNFDRYSENTELRMKHDIPHVLVYQSPVEVA